MRRCELPFSLGVGIDARIKVKLKDKTKLEGYIKEAGNEHFVITDARTGADTAVAYPQVSTAQGQNLSKGAKIAIGVGIAAAIVIVILFIAYHGFTLPNFREESRHKEDIVTTCKKKADH